MAPTFKKTLLAVRPPAARSKPTPTTVWQPMPTNIPPAARGRKSPKITATIIAGPPTKPPTLGPIVPKPIVPKDTELPLVIGAGRPPKPPRVRKARPPRMPRMPR